MKTNERLLVSMLAVLAIALPASAQDVWDSDGDGFDDNTDNCTLTANPLQRDTDGDFMGNMCDGDLDQNGIMNFLDYSVMVENFLGSNDDTDLNGDGNTNFLDIGLFANMFMATPGPTGTDPLQPPCTCYFGGDCAGGSFCDYGPGGFGTEDICAWRDVKPFGVEGAGCSIESDLTTGEWTSDICDGVCRSGTQGSHIGLEKTDSVAQVIGLWGSAMMVPSINGGGVVDEALAEAARSVQFSAGSDIPVALGRYAADALAMASGDAFHDYYCHYEGHPEDPNQPVVNLANQNCLIASGEMTMDALVSELKNPGTARAIMEPIAIACPDYHTMFGTQCESGPNALNCAIQYIEAQAYFLRTPPVGGNSASPADPVMDLISKTIDR